MKHHRASELHQRFRIVIGMTKHPYLPHEKLLDLLLDVVCVVDLEGRFLSVSASSERVFGYTPE